MSSSLPSVQYEENEATVTALTSVRLLYMGNYLDDVDAIGS
jgi:hypothetical protein